MHFKGTWEYKHGVPPSGGGARANTMILKMFNALETADDSPAEAGTPNLKSTPNQGKSNLIKPNQGKK